MGNLNPKFFAIYIIFGSIVHFWYGLFFHLFYLPPGEPLWARWPVVIFGLGVGFSILIFRLDLKWSERLFNVGIFLFSWHCIYLMDNTHLPQDYFQAFTLLIIACSLMVFDLKVLLIYLFSTSLFALLVAFRIEGSFSTSFQVMNLIILNCIVLFASFLKIQLTQKLNLARELSENSKKHLELSYKNNLQAAHDLSSPVSAINVVAEKIKYEDPKLYKMLQSSVERIKDISRDLLVEHREKREQVESDFFDIENNISQIVADKRQEYKDTPHFFIMYRVTAPVINQVKIPKTEFYRVLSNIINNSMDAMERQTEKRIKIVIDPRPEDVSLLITDNGEGISEDQVAHIFEENVSFKEDGTGLGLSFARQKVREWGGEIHLKSTSGKGTTFELIIPFSFT